MNFDEVENLNVDTNKNSEENNRLTDFDLSYMVLIKNPNNEIMFGN